MANARDLKCSIDRGAGSLREVVLITHQPEPSTLLYMASFSLSTSATLGGMQFTASAALADDRATEDKALFYLGGSTETGLQLHSHH